MFQFAKHCFRMDLWYYIFDILAEDNDDNSDDEDEGIIGGFIHNRIQQGRAAINLLNRLN